MTDFISSVRKRPGMYVGFSDRRGICVMLEYLLEFVQVLFRRGECFGAEFRLGDSIEFCCDFVPFDGFESCFENRFDFRAGDPAINNVFCVVNGLSSELEAEIRYGENGRLLRFKEGEPVGAGSDIPGGQKCGLRVIFRPDRRFFGESRVRTAEFSSRVREFTACNSGVKITVCEGEYSELFCCENGLIDYTGYIFNNILPNDAAFIPISVGDGVVTVEAVLCLPYLCGDCPDYERVISFANGRRTNQGGVHVEGFLEGVWNAFRELGCGYKECSSITAGVVNLEMKNVPYGGSTREYVLSDDEFTLHDKIAGLVGSSLTEYFRENRQAAVLAADIIRQYT